MSNSHSNREQGKTIEQTENQRNPFLARPEDFEVLSAEEAAKPMETPFHGQCGDSESEYRRLSKETEGLTGEGTPLTGGNVDHSAKPHTPGLGGKRKRAS